jgi:hypothetical protein
MLDGREDALLVVELSEDLFGGGREARDCA